MDELISVVAFKSRQGIIKPQYVNRPEHHPFVRMVNFTDGTLMKVGFHRKEVNLWVLEEGEATLYFDHAGIARLAIWRGNKLLLSGGAQNIHQLRHLLQQ